MQRITGKSGQLMAPGTAQKDIGNLKKIYAEYYNYYGDEDRPNPFRNLRFKNIDVNQRPAFDLIEIQKIYQSLNIQNLNFEARMIMYVCADTGCRPSEICGLEESNIHLDEEYPYLEIKDMPGRKLKTRSSNRTIPLVGVALEAMKLIPNGAKRYKFKETQLSATINKFLRSNEFLPTLNHSFYSFRHAIMDRMEVADIEDEFRRGILGHSINKPNYGDGGNMKFRYEKMKKIEIGFNPLIFTNLD
ncbi:MAG: tyrosine-type recombinase/integrase [Hyphomicrobiales bacterium]